MKNITFSADERLIEACRNRAREENTTLNDVFRRWLADYAESRERVQRYDELMRAVRGTVVVGDMPSRAERPAR